jgi:hypothetical protein
MLLTMVESIDRFPKDTKIALFVRGSSSMSDGL